MLTGRESLIRLIGKRRRYLPNRQSILSSAVQRSLNLTKGRNEDEGPSVKNVVEAPESDWVSCPVCGNQVRGDDRVINSHLDGCLTRGTKRKLSQRTLLQLNFCSRIKVTPNSAESEHNETNIVQTIPDKDAEDGMFSNCNSPGAEENDRCQYKYRSSDYVTDTADVGSAENIIHDKGISYQVDSPPLISELSKLDTAETVDDISEKLLATYIVARRLGDKVELYPGATISLSRDPNNPKDPNAIKVLTADSGRSKAVGFLPRDLAQYLSPLIDKFGLSFEGTITSIPDHALAVVPVSIRCQKKVFFGEKECENRQVFNSLWKLVLRVVDCAKPYALSWTKYQENFVLLMEEILRTNSHLLTADEKKFLGPWFRLSNISYNEILDCQLAATGLSAAGYVCLIESSNDLHKDDLEDVLNVLAVSELREILSTINKNCSRGSRKQDLIASLFCLYENGLCPTLPRIIFEKAGVCVRISSKAESLVWRAERLFFLNGEQDLSAFLLSDLGIVKFPCYNCIISDQIFSCRNDLLSYEEAIEVAQIMDHTLDENNSEIIVRCIEIANSRISSSTARDVELSLVPYFLRFSAAWVYSKVVLLGVSFLEHENRYMDAIKLLKRLLLNFTSDRRRGYWTLRLSIDLEHVGRVNESLSVAEDGLLDPWVRAGSRISLQRRVLRLGKPPRRWRTPSFSESVKRKIPEVHVQGRPLNCKAGIRSRFYGEDGDQCGVEQLALQYYAGEGGGWQGVHSESGIWLTIFGLLMWDVIFADVPNVFRNKFQTAPLDLETDGFYEARKNIIEPLLKQIQDGLAEEILITSWESHVGTACRGINWETHSLSNLRAVVSCVGGTCLASMCRHLAQDYRSWSSGMPDLLLWRFHGDYRGEAKLVEVKGPRDRLSEQQCAWLLFLMDSGFNAEVCKVSPAPVSS